MPTYEYICESCGNQLEQFQSITAKPLRKCPACGKNKLKRLIGAGAGVIFKGSGFYATDYRSEGYKRKSESETKTAAPAKDAGENLRKNNSISPVARNEDLLLLPPARLS
jgi:putative FmdB family regulatory protein